jgi:membrane protein DedA with SNARE-associated domain
VIRVLTWALVIFFIWYMLTSPAGAAAWVHGVLGLIAHAGSSLSAFVDSLLAPAITAIVIVGAVFGYLASIWRRARPPTALA